MSDVATADTDTGPAAALRARAGRVLGANTSVHELPPPTRQRPEGLTALADVTLQMCHVIWRSELSAVRLDMVFNTLVQYSQSNLPDKEKLVEGWTGYYGLNGDDGVQFTRFMTGDVAAFRRIKQDNRSTPAYHNL